ncbi:MAG: shikimate kinase [Akkermansiaceae bacterium]
MRALIIGNSGSGKSTLAKNFVKEQQGAHLDLDTLAWSKEKPTERRSLAESVKEIDAFLLSYTNWVIEGCYSDLIRYVVGHSTHLYFLNLSVESCVANCRNRPWEPHKYESKQAQDANLEMLIEWVGDYMNRDDDFSYRSHRKIFDQYGGCKTEITSNQGSAKPLA